MSCSRRKTFIVRFGGSPATPLRLSFPPTKGVCSHTHIQELPSLGEGTQSPGLAMPLFFTGWLVIEKIAFSPQSLFAKMRVVAWDFQYWMGNSKKVLELTGMLETMVKSESVLSKGKPIKSHWFVSSRKAGQNVFLGGSGGYLFNMPSSANRTQ